MKHLLARSTKWYPDPTVNPIRKLARRAIRLGKVNTYRGAILDRLVKEHADANKITSTLALFDNVIASAQWKAQNTKPTKSETKIKRILREWREAV